MSSAFFPSTPVSTGFPAGSADVFSQNLTWDEAFREFSIHLQATRAQKTQRYYEVQLKGLIRWAAEQDVPFDGFGKHHSALLLAGIELTRRSRACFPNPL